MAYATSGRGSAKTVRTRQKWWRRAIASLCMSASVNPRKGRTREREPKRPLASKGERRATVRSATAPVLSGCVT